MTVIAVCMVRDEADIIAATVGQMLTQVDYVIVADNGSTDDTRDIVQRFDRVTVIDDPDPAYHQSRKMTALAQRAAEMGADWVVPFDADEWWWSPHGRIANYLERLSFDVVEAVLYDHVATGQDSTDPDPVRRLPWRRSTQVAMPKVACRFRPGMRIEQGNHSVTYNDRPAAIAAGLHVHHYPYRSVEQFIRKVRNGAAAYNADPAIRPDFGAHWRQWGRLLDEQGEEAVGDIFRKWYWRADPTLPIVIDREWQTALVWDPPT